MISKTRKLGLHALLVLASILAVGADKCDEEPKDCSEGGSEERCSTDGETLNGRCVAGVCVTDSPQEPEEDEPGSDDPN